MIEILFGAITLGTVGMILLVLFLLASIGASLEENKHQTEAVEAGVAEFYLDENHQRQFRYKKLD